MPTFIPAPLTTCLLCLFVSSFPDTTELKVTLQNQSVRTGTPDRSTNDSLLRLRVGEPDAYIVYGIEWSQISLVRSKSKSWEPSQFAELRNEIAAMPPITVVGDATRSAVEPSITPTRPLWQSPPRPAACESESDRVQYIEFDATAANWNGDPEIDGIVLRVWPINQFGQVIQASGTLTVSLTGERDYRELYSNFRIGHWVRGIRPGDYNSDGFTARLQFQNYDPERWGSAGHPDHWIAPYGEVHVTFAVPGHGVFQASTTTPIRLRRFSPQRDRLFLRNSSRSYFNEP